MYATIQFVLVVLFADVFYSLVRNSSLRMIINDLLGRSRFLRDDIGIIF